MTNSSSANDLLYSLPPIGGNPSTRPNQTNPGSFANPPQIAPGAKGALTFSSPDTPGMPAPSEKTAWDFMPAGWQLKPGCEENYETADAWTPPSDFLPVTQLEFARCGHRKWNGLPNGNHI